jgi:hypothetical protein
MSILCLINLIEEQIENFECRTKAVPDKNPHFHWRAFVRPVNFTGGLCPPSHFWMEWILSRRAFVRFPKIFTDFAL